MNPAINEALGLTPEQAEYLDKVAEANGTTEADILKGALDVLRGMAQRRSGTVIDTWAPYSEDPTTFRLPFDPSAHTR